MKERGKHDSLMKTEAARAVRHRTRRETSADRLVYFAAERTLFSWVSAALGLMALGFVVDRFSLILEEQIIRGPANRPANPFSSWIGVVLISVGVAASVIASVRFMRFEARYHRRVDTRPGHGLSWGVFFTLTIAALGVIIILFLILTLR